MIIILIKVLIRLADSFDGQCKTKTADCRLQTADCGPGVKCRLQTESKTQTGVKCRPSINCSRGRV